MVIRRVAVTENLGKSPVSARHGAPAYDPSAEEIALTAAHDAQRAVLLLAGDPTQHADELGPLLDRLYEAWGKLGVLPAAYARVSVDADGDVCLDIVKPEVKAEAAEKEED
jgi:hypothetical protein